MNRKFQSLIYTFSQGNPQILLIFIITALFVTIARVLAPVNLMWDSCEQIQASNRLIEGLGLTVVSVQNSPNLNDPPSLQLLTAWPPGFSLVLALFLRLGFSLAISLKILYGLTTIIGWLGWGIIGCYCLKKPLKIFSIVLPTQFILAAILPLFYTPRWVATDIFLWAGVPFFVIILFNSIKNNTTNNRLIILASIIASFEVYFRYSAIFLIILGFLIILQKGLPSIKIIIKSSLLFFFSLGLLIAPLFIYLKIATVGRSFEQINLQSQYANFSLWQSFLKILQSSSVIVNILGYPLQKEQHYIFDLDIVASLIGLICLISILLLPVFVSFNDIRIFGFNGLKNNPSLSISLIPISIVTILLVSNLTSWYDYLGTSRYYLSAVISTILLIYQLATISFDNYLKIIKYSCLIFILVFLSCNLIIRTGLNPRNQSLITFPLNLLASDSFRTEYPSNKMMTAFDQTIAEFKKLQKQNPEATFFLNNNNHPHFLFEDKSFKKNIKIISFGFPHEYAKSKGMISSERKFWERAYVARKTTIYWVQPIDCPYAAICEVTPVGLKMTFDKFSDDTIVETVFQYPKEGSKIIKTYFPKPSKITS